MHISSITSSATEAEDMWAHIVLIYYYGLSYTTIAADGLTREIHVQWVLWVWSHPPYRGSWLSLLLAQQ